MININNVIINSNYSIVVDINTTPGYRITQVLLWTIDTFKDYTKSIDFSNHLSGLTNQENFFITANEIEPNSNRLDSIYFLEFTSNEPNSSSVCIENANKNIAVVANTTLYQECLLNKVLQTNIEGCSEKEDINCEECQENSKDIRYLSTLLKSLDIAIRLGYIEETLKIFKSLDKICKICHNCPDYGNLVAGYGYGTVNNSIIIV